MLLGGAGWGRLPDDNFQGRKNETELFWLCLHTAEQWWETAPREMPREKRMFCCVGFLFWALFISDISQPGRQSMEAI